MGGWVGGSYFADEGNNSVFCTSGVSHMRTITDADTEM